MAADRVGEILGNYTLLRVLGQGSFAEVYLGEHRYLERPAAIKVLHVRMQHAAAHDAFLAEAKLIARLQHPETTPTPLPTGTRITQVYDEADGELLILGAPGSGKTTLLLELARDLLKRAEHDEQHPMPVIFSLSSWATKQQSLVDWLGEELNTKYQVPRKLATTLLEAEQILPLLDGLDEVMAKERTHCIEAINSYRREHGTQPLVVCSRSTDYLAQTSRVLLESAVVIQPLSSQQVEQALHTAGPTFSGLRVALQHQQSLRDLVTTPLMLSVFLLTYQGVSTETIAHGQVNLEQRVWTDYVARMVRPRGMKAHASLEDTRHWLASLAQQMCVHQQTIFYAEYMQADWLVHSQQHIVTWLATRLPAIVIGLCVGLLVPLLMGFSSNFVLLLQVVVLSGFVGDCLSQQVVAGPVRVRNHLFAGFKAFFNFPSCSDGLDHLDERGAHWGKDEVVGFLAWVVNATADQQEVLSVIFPLMEHGHHRPIKEPWPFGAITHTEPMPILSAKRVCLGLGYRHPFAAFCGLYSHGFIAGHR